jgi:hypothetical protein
VRDAAEIVRVWNTLRTRYNDRNLRYKFNWYAYNGEYDKITPAYAHSKLKDVRQNRERNIQTWNLVFPIVEAHRMLINRLPGIEVPAAVMADPLAAAFAEKQERMHYCLWDAGDMKRKHSKGSFNIALYNSTTWFVRWDSDRDYPVITARKPGETYPVFKRRGDEVAYCLFVFMMDEDELAEAYPESKKLLSANKGGGSGKTQVEVIEYVDDRDYGIVIGGKYASLLSGASHDLGFCPVIITPGAYVEGEDGDYFPPGAIDQIVALNDYLNRFQTKWGDALEQILFPGAILKGEGADQVVWEDGPGAVNRIPFDTVEYVPPQYPNMPSEVFIHLQRIESLMRRIANFPESASGEMDASIITGQAVSKLQGTMTGMAVEAQDSLGAGLAKCNEWMFRMLEAYRPKKKYSMYSSDSLSARSAPGRSESFSVEFIPSEDINGYYRNRLVYSALGSDPSLAMTLGMQLVQSDVVSRRWFRNQIPGVGDAEGMGLEIEEEKRRRLQLEVDLQVQAQQRMLQSQAQIQQAAQGGATPQGGAPNGEIAPPQTEGGLAPPGAAPGAVAQTGQPAQIGNTTLLPGGRPAMMGMGEPASGEEGFPLPYTELKPFNVGLDVLLGQGQQPTGLEGEMGRGAITFEEASKILAAIDKLKGQIYLTGEIVPMEYGGRGATSGKVEVIVTVKLDKATVVNGVRGTVLEGRIAFTVIPAGEVPPNAVPVGAATTNKSVAA